MSTRNTAHLVTITIRTDADPSTTLDAAIEGLEELCGCVESYGQSCSGDEESVAVEESNGLNLYRISLKVETEADPSTVLECAAECAVDICETIDNCGSDAMPILGEECVQYA